MYQKKYITNTFKNYIKFYRNYIEKQRQPRKTFIKRTEVYGPYQPGIKKLSKAIGIVSKLRHFVSKEVTLLYYNLYIKPVIQFEILVYGGTYKAHLNKVATMQRKLLRLIFFKRTGSVETEMINAQILSVPQLYVYETMKFAFRSIRQEMPTEHMNNLFQRKQSNRSCRSENNSRFVTPFVCNNWEKFSLRYRGTRLLNVLIDQGLYPNDLLQFSQSKLDNTIYEANVFYYLYQMITYLKYSIARWYF